MQDKLGFGGGPTYEYFFILFFFWLSTVMLNEYYLIFVLLFDMHVIILLFKFEYRYIEIFFIKINK